MILFFKKSKVGREPAQTTGNDRLEYFRKLIMDHLDTLKNDGDKTLVKATGTARHFVFVMGKGAKMSVGTIREWKGKKYVKTGDGWKPKYDSHGRGAKLAIAAIKRKVASAKDAQEMMQIVLENRDRFSDKDGHPLPFVQELSKYVSEAQEYLPENIKTKRKEARSAAIKEGQRKVAERKAAGIQTEIRLGMAHYRNGELSAGDAFARMRGNGVPTDKAREAFGLKPNSSGSFKDAMKEQLGIDIDKKAGEPSEKGVPAEKSAESDDGGGIQQGRIQQTVQRRTCPNTHRDGQDGAGFLRQIGQKRRRTSTGIAGCGLPDFDRPGCGHKRRSRRRLSKIILKKG